MLRTVAVMAIVPMVLWAQAGASGSATTQASARGIGVQGTTTVEAELELARTKKLPEGPIRRRVDEGKAKGASEAQQAEAARKARVTMETAVEAMKSGGRATPTDEEIDRGTTMMERGYTKSQVEVVAKSAPSDRSLVVAFDVLTKLNERGVPVAKALAQVTAKLEARQPDVDIQTLLGAQAGGAVGVTKPPAASGVIRKP